MAVEAPRMSAVVSFKNSCLVVSNELCTSCVRLRGVLQDTCSGGCPTDQKYLTVPGSPQAQIKCAVHANTKS